MDQPLAGSALRRAVRQYLEDLARSGVEHLPCAGPTASARPIGPAPPGDADQPPSGADVLAPPTAPIHAPDQHAGAQAAGSQPVRFDRPARSAASPSDAAAATGGRRPGRAAKEAQLNVLAQQVCACTLCPELVASRSRTVFGVGNPNARLCFFGEAPGADEDRQGEPFVGRAGQLLTKIIEACGWKRSDVYIMNVLKCRPPENRNPLPPEVDNCRQYFERQFEILRPEYIVCVGTVPAQALLETTESVGKMRGRFFPYRDSKVLVTYHPSYLLRNPAAKKYVWEDMQLLLKDMGLPVPGRSTG